MVCVWTKVSAKIFILLATQGHFGPHNFKGLFEDSGLVLVGLELS